jgi:hypothetical protein
VSAHIDLLDVTRLRAAAELRVVQAMSRAQLFEQLALIAEYVSSDHMAAAARRVAAELVDEVTVDERTVALAAEVLEAAQTFNDTHEVDVETTQFMFDLEFEAAEEDLDDGRRCAECNDTIDVAHDMYCEVCAFPDNDGEQFNYADHFKHPGRSLRIVSVTSDGKSGAMMLVGPLAEVQAAAKLFGAHVRLVEVESAPVTLEVAAINADPPLAGPEEDVADHAPDWSAS